MRVKRIVANVNTENVSEAKSFYKDVLQLDTLMDHGWIETYGLLGEDGIQISFASQGGSNTPTPDLSIEVDDVDEVFEHMKSAGFSIEYGPVDEPWGVRRFYVRDPFGKLINILAHRGGIL
jgi:catechol 2,3-dioxygenase-like lactoylglutathione lyase family enzyme